MKNIILISILIFGFVPAFNAQPTASSSENAEEYFNLAANQYINKKNIEALKTIEKGLKVEPENEDLKELADLILKQKQNKNQQNKNQQNKNKKNQDKKNQDKKKQNQQNQQQNQQNKNKKKNQPQPQKISKEDAKRILEALQNEEKNIQDKVKKEKAKANRVKVEKDW